MMKKGFTLIEVLVVVFLASVIFSALFMVMSSGRTTWHEADAGIALQQELRKAMRQISDDLRQTGMSQISIPADGVTYGSVSFNISNGAGGSGSVVWSANPINLSLSGGQIIRTDGSVVRVLANNITSLGFLRQVASAKVVRVSVAAQKTSTFGRVLNATLDSAIAIRN